MLRVLCVKNSAGGIVFCNPSSLRIRIVFTLLPARASTKMPPSKNVDCNEHQITVKVCIYLSPKPVRSEEKHSPPPPHAVKSHAAADFVLLM